MKGSAEVLVVGGGPTGLLAGALLGRRGVRVLVVEQNPTTSEQAKAISLDDESLRILQRGGLDLLERVLQIVLPGTGTRYFGADGRVLAHARGPRPSRHGHPIKSSFQQPQLERVLRQAVEEQPGVELAFSTALVDLRQDAEGVTVELEQADGRRQTQRVAYVLGADGGRSAVRRLVGIEMRGTSYRDQPWLVLDTVGDPHDERYGLHIGRPERPTVIIPGLDGHCRYEFRLRPGEAEPGDQVPFELIRDLLRPYRGAVEPADVVRMTVYTFNALVAERWRAGRVFLLGDAAHMMPPFAGQGLNSGVRDVGNLAWKVAGVLTGWAGSSLLDTYEAERRPHAEATVRLSARLGEIVMTTNSRRARLRDMAVHLVRLAPPGRRYLDEMRFRPPQDYRAGLVAKSTPEWPAAVGRVLEQPWVLHVSGGRCLLDEALGSGFALVAIDPRRDVLGELRDPLWDQIGARRLELMTGDRWARRGTTYPVVVDEDGRLKPALRAYRQQVVLVRPDGFVAAIFPTAHQSHIVGALRARMGSPESDAAAALREPVPWRACRGDLPG